MFIANSNYQNFKSSSFSEISKLAKTLSSPSEVNRARLTAVKSILEKITKSNIEENCKIELFGSAESGLGEKSCDVDATVILPPYMDKSPESIFNLVMNFGQKIIDFYKPPIFNDYEGVSDDVSSVFSNFINPTENNSDPMSSNNSSGNNNNCANDDPDDLSSAKVELLQIVASAKVPILVLRLDLGPIFGEDNDPFRYPVCDLSIQNILPIFNTKLIKSYVQIDERILSLILVVKKLTKLFEVNNSKNGCLSSYTWTLMTIYFLQIKFGLPSLQEKRKSDDFIICEITGRTYNTSFCSPNEEKIQWKCTATLKELFLQFFSFYSQEYKWGHEVVSVRKGSSFDFVKFPELKIKKHFKDIDQSFLIHIEDPFDIERNLNCVMTISNIFKLKEFFHKMNKMESSQNFRKNSISDFYVKDCDILNTNDITYENVINTLIDYSSLSLLADYSDGNFNSFNNKNSNGGQHFKKEKETGNVTSPYNRKFHHKNHHKGSFDDFYQHKENINKNNKKTYRENNFSTGRQRCFSFDSTKSIKSHWLLPPSNNFCFSPFLDNTGPSRGIKRNEDFFIIEMW